MIRKAVEIGKHNVPEDNTIENYHALIAAILSPGTNILANYSHLYNATESANRIKEIEQVRSKKRKTELQLWWEKVAKRERASKKKRKSKEHPNRYILAQHKEELDKYCKTPQKEIPNYNFKTIDVRTGEEKIYTSREELSKAIGIESSHIVSPYIRNKIAFNKKYLITLCEKQGE
ncbi:MAG: hypothetical protein ACRDD7_06740 [Peptostreptococcaceae bacterium]